MTAVVVRDASVGDARAVAELHVRTWRAAYRGIVPIQLLDDLSVDLREEMWRSLLGEGGVAAFTLLAGDPDGALAGFCAVALPSRDDDAGARTAEVAATYVDPTRWGQGVGRALMTQALNRLDADAWDEATLWTFMRNAHGRAFYARLGFRLDGTRRTNEASGATEARLRTALGTAS